MASGRRSSAPSPKPIAMGSRASTVVMVVIKIGRSRFLPARSMASRSWVPFRRAWLIKSTLMMASFTTIPTSTTNPIKDITLKLWPVTSKPITTPIIAKGMVRMIMNGFSRLSNWAARIRNTNTNASRKAKVIWRKDSIISWRWPPM